MSTAANVSLNLSVYEHAELYDVAFSYRDFKTEAQALIAFAQAALGRRPKRALELCAGPADHAIALAEAEVASTALDLSDAMCAYATAKAKRQGVHIDVMAADMRDFALPTRVDLAFTPLNSISHLHDFDDLVRHFVAVGHALVDDGLYILEVQHPKDFVGRGPRKTGVSDSWTVEKDGMTLTTTWGKPTDPYDPIRQIFDAHVILRAERNGEVREEREVVRMRDWTRDEMVAAAKLAATELPGTFPVVLAHGGLDPTLPLDGSDDSWRMVLGFQRKK